MKIGDTIQGFELISITPVEELKAQLHLFRHIETGAELLWTCREDVNKTFAVAFKTIPEDSTGVFHILEHSVLCGSEKYPVKEPFVELLKGSMQTFLNAMTFPDKTVYPVASRNDADFRNLMSVYLDAVFRPQLLTNPHIFEQEGWHYEQGEDGRMHVVGVVYGEMEGAYSSVERVLSRKLEQLMYPDSCYGLSSGGDPEKIPELSCEQFVSTYRRFYHPGNARFFLDGSVAPEQCMADIASYINGCGSRALDADVTLQAPVAGFREECYEAAPEDAEACYAAMGKLVGGWQDVEKLLALTVLNDYLAGSNQAPMKRRVLERGLGKDLALEVNSGTAQMDWNLTVKKTDKAQLASLRPALRSIAEEILAEGLDHEELTACINRLEFRVREHQEPMGVYLCIDVLQSWLYGGDPALYLQSDRAFAALRAMLEQGGFEALFRQLLLEEDGLCEVHLLPSVTLGDERRAAAQARVDAVTSAWTEEERTAQARSVADLQAWHRTPDSAEALATIPHLKLADLSAEPEWIPVHEASLGDTTVLRTDVACNGAVYLELAFDLGELKADELAVASLLTDLYGELPTERYAVRALQHQIRLHLGRLDTMMITASRRGEPDRCTPYLLVSCSVLEHEQDAAAALIREMLMTTRFDDKTAIRTILQQRQVSLRQRMVSAGHMYAMQQAASGLTAESYASNCMGGIGYIQQIERWLALNDEELDALCGQLARIAGSLAADRLTVCASGPVDDEKLRALCAAFPKAGGSKQTLCLPDLRPQRTGAVIPAAVGYSSMAVCADRVGTFPQGTLQVMAKLLSLNFLWNEIRVQGGAYGTGLRTAPDGVLTTYSYRDPNPGNSLRVYRSMAEALEAFCDGEQSLEEIMIGAIGDSEPLLSPKQQGRRALGRWLRGRTYADEKACREEMLHTDREKLRGCAALLRTMAEEGSVCVLAGEPVLNAMENEQLTRL